MSGVTLGAELNNGFIGNYARQPDMIIGSAPNTSGSDIEVGTVLVWDSINNGVKPFAASNTAADIVGVACKEVKSNWNFGQQSMNDGLVFKPKEAVPYFQRGSINVLCANGTAARGGAVNIAITTSAFSGAVVGQLFAGSGTGTLNTDYLAVPNCQWGGAKDVNGTCEVVFLTRANA